MKGSLGFLMKGKQICKAVILRSLEWESRTEKEKLYHGTGERILIVSVMRICRDVEMGNVEWRK